jgi:DNA polymerase zeta
MVLEMLEDAEIITKTACVDPKYISVSFLIFYCSEFARVFGVDFYSVISRGSQFKVESFMFRIAKPESFVLLSPSKQDVGKSTHCN